MVRQKFTFEVPEVINELSDLTSPYNTPSKTNNSEEDDGWSEEDALSTPDKLLDSLQDYHHHDPSKSYMYSRADQEYAAHQIREHRKQIAADKEWKKVGKLTSEELQVLQAVPTQTSTGRTYSYILPTSNRYGPLAEEFDGQHLATDNIKNRDEDDQKSNYNTNTIIVQQVASTPSKQPHSPNQTSSLIDSIKHAVYPSFSKDTSVNSEEATRHTSNISPKLQLLSRRTHQSKSPTQQNKSHTITTATKAPIDQTNITSDHTNSSNDTNAERMVTEDQGINRNPKDRPMKEPTKINEDTNMITHTLLTQTTDHKEQQAIKNIAPDLTQVPTDNTAIWHTTIDFPILPQEVKTGYLNKIKERLTSFLPAVLAHTQGTVLPWDDTNPTFNPTKDIHLICENRDILANYFKYELTPKNNKISGYMRILVNASTKSIYHIKTKLLTVAEALNKYSIGWHKTYLTTMEKDTPLFLVGIHEKTNFTQLNLDLKKQCDINFPIHITRRQQEAKGKKSDDKEHKIRIPVLKLSCSKEHTKLLSEKLFTHLGPKSPIHEDLIHSSIPFIKVMYTWPHGIWTEQMIFDHLFYQQRFIETSTSVAIHHIHHLEKEVSLLGETKTIRAHIASFVHAQERVVLSVDNGGGSVGKVWVTIKSNTATNQFIQHLNALFNAMREWDQTYLHDITGSYHYPCWSSDPTQAPEQERNYLTHMGYNIQDLQSFPSFSRQKKNPYNKLKAQTTWAQVTSQAPGSQSSQLKTMQSQNVESSSPITLPQTVQSNQTTNTSSTYNQTRQQTTDPTPQHSTQPDQTQAKQLQAITTRLFLLEQSHTTLQESFRQQQDESSEKIRAEIHTSLQSNNSKIIDQLQQLQQTNIQQLNDQFELSLSQFKVTQDTISSNTNNLLQTISDSMIQLNSLSFLQPLELTVKKLQSQLSSEVSAQTKLIKTCLSQQQILKDQQVNLERRYNGMYDAITNNNTDIPAEHIEQIPKPISSEATALTIYSPSSPGTPRLHKIPRQNPTGDTDSNSYMGSQTSELKRASGTILATQPPFDSLKQYTLPSALGEREEIQ